MMDDDTVRQVDLYLHTENTTQQSHNLNDRNHTSRDQLQGANTMAGTDIATGQMFSPEPGSDNIQHWKVSLTASRPSWAQKMVAGLSSWNGEVWRCRHSHAAGSVAPRYF